MNAEGIDWSAIRERLARAQAAVEGGRSGKRDADVQRELEARRVRLARPSAATTSPAATEYLEFRVDDEAFAVDMARLIEVVRAAGVAKLPGASDEIVGIANVHGTALLVLDPALLAGASERSRRTGSTLIVLGHQRREVALLVDTVDKITLVESTRIARTETASGSVLQGVVDGRVLLLSSDALLDLESLRAPAGEGS